MWRSTGCSTGCSWVVGRAAPSNELLSRLPTAAPCPALRCAFCAFLLLLQLIAAHREKNADITIAMHPVGASEAPKKGIAKVHQSSGELPQPPAPLPRARWGRRRRRRRRVLCP